MSLEHQGENAELDDCSWIQSGWLPPALQDQEGEVRFSFPQVISITMHNVAASEYLRLEGIVYPKVKILALFIHRHVISMTFSSVPPPTKKRKKGVLKTPSPYKVNYTSKCFPPFFMFGGVIDDLLLVNLLNRSF